MRKRGHLGTLLNIRDILHAMKCLILFILALALSASPLIVLEADGEGGSGSNPLMAP